MTDTEQKLRLPDDETVPESDEKTATASQIRGNDEIYRMHREGRLGQGSFPSSTGDFDTSLREYTVKRDNNLPLRFTGRLVGWNEVDFAVPRGTRVTIYVTRSNRIITAVHQWQRGGKRERSRYDAGVHTGPEEALAWLVQDGGQQLGRSSREAWEVACQLWPAFKGHDVEVID
jgi:hypothetical protein